MPGLTAGGLFARVCTVFWGLALQQCARHAMCVGSFCIFGHATPDGRCAACGAGVSHVDVQHCSCSCRRRAESDGWLSAHCGEAVGASPSLAADRSSSSAVTAHMHGWQPTSGRPRSCDARATASHHQHVTRPARRQQKAPAVPLATSIIIRLGSARFLRCSDDLSTIPATKPLLKHRKREQLRARHSCAPGALSRFQCFRDHVEHPLSQPQHVQHRRRRAAGAAQKGDSSSSSAGGTGVLRAATAAMDASQAVHAALTAAKHHCIMMCRLASSLWARAPRGWALQRACSSMATLTGCSSIRCASCAAPYR